MPYQSLAVAFLLGFGLATAAICFLVEGVANRRLENPYGNRGVGDDPPPNSWAPRGSNSSNTQRRKSRRRGEGDIEDKCSICFQSITWDLNRTKTLSCGHCFHIPCIGKWIEEKGRSASCPNCRQVI